MEIRASCIVEMIIEPFSAMFLGMIVFDASFLALSREFLDALVGNRPGCSYRTYF